MSCIAMMNAAGKFVEYEVTVETAGTYKVTMRYANGNADLSNCFKVSVDGELQPVSISTLRKPVMAMERVNGTTLQTPNHFMSVCQRKHILRFEANGNNPNYDYMVLKE